MRFPPGSYLPSSFELRASSIFTTDSCPATAGVQTVYGSRECGNVGNVGNVEMWECGDVEIWGCEDVEIKGLEGRNEFYKWSCLEN
jgi:hypothetical protein